MELKKYIANLAPADRECFAEKVGTTKGHLQNAAYGYRACSPELAVAIERFTNKQVTRQELRPDDFWLIWPDLKKPKSTQPA